jgi:formate dehydrogenase subunit gamma
VLLATGGWILLGGEGRPSPLARILDLPDAGIHVWTGWVLAAALVVPAATMPTRVIRFVRETFRIDRGDAEWWRRWPRAILTGSFARHEGRFDPGQRVANVVMLGGLILITGTGIGMTLSSGGPLFAWTTMIHRWATILITPVIVCHILVATGILPGYRSVWRAMHAGGRVPIEVARRLWPGWAEREMDDLGRGG